MKSKKEPVQLKPHRLFLTVMSGKNAGIKNCNKQHITVDNSTILLYTVCDDGGHKYAYYTE